MNSISLSLDDIRRLTGPNLLSDKPGSVADVFIQGVAADKVVQCWQHHVSALLIALDLGDEQVFTRLFDGGASLAISSPIDLLYSCCDINETAWQHCCLEIEGEALPDLSPVIQALKQAIVEESNPKLLALESAAKKQQAPFLWDDDEVSIGHGAGVQLWETLSLPSPDEVHWLLAKPVPCALITGTNGKSTSVRLASKVAELAGNIAGVTSTDFIRVGDDILDEGDYSGPGGARILLRDSRTELALLEVARGGILRRGLPIDTAKAALITNLAEDHLGDYGINTLAELTQVKFIVAKALHNDSILVLNADDASSVEQSKQVENTICWFSLYEDNPVIQRHRQANGDVVFLSGGNIVYQQGQSQNIVAAVNDIPMCLGGAAKHNIANALGVTGLCKALGFSDAEIAKGLCAFQSNAADNPGRGNQFSYNGSQVFIDFAHNVHSMNAIVSTLKALPAKRRLLLLGHAGDRSDKDMQGLIEAANNLGVDHWVLAEFPNYLRGRALGEIPAIMAKQLAQFGVDETAISYADSALSGAEKALAWANEGDQLLLLALDERRKIFELLET